MFMTRCEYNCYIGNSERELFKIILQLCSYHSGENDYYFLPDDRYIPLLSLEGASKQPLMGLGEINGILFKSITLKDIGSRGGPF
jgi:hypothetical protein